MSQPSKVKVGERIGSGKLTVKSEGPVLKNKQTTYGTVICLCECGNEIVVSNSHATEGRPYSCGCTNPRLKLLNDEASLRELWYGYRRGASDRGFVFELNHSKFREITSKDCTYCGAKPAKVSRARKGTKIPYIYNGVDRIDNTIGYTKDNCTPCCAVCNRMKFQLPQTDFIEHAKRIAAFCESTNAS